MTSCLERTWKLVLYKIDPMKVYELGSGVRIASVPTKVGEAIPLIEQDGWYRVKSRGGHRQFKHPSKPGRVTISGSLGDDLAPGTLNSILKQAGLKK